jgi:hypothetical protein
MPLPLPGSASCICMLLRPFVLRAQDGKPGQGLIDPTESNGSLQTRPSCLALGHPQPIGAEGRVLYTAAWDIPQVWNMFWESVQHFAGVFLAVHPHSTLQNVHICPSISSLRNFIRADR